MAEYIERKAVCNRIEEIMRLCSSDIAYETLLYLKLSLPAAVDVAEVKHGKWITKPTDGHMTYCRCSNCNNQFFYTNRKKLKEDYRYCNICGAKMDGKDSAHE